MDMEETCNVHTKACSQGPRCRSAARALGAWLPEAQIQQQMLILARKPSKSKREEKTFPCLLQTGEGFSSRLDLPAFGMETTCFAHPAPRHANRQDALPVR